MGWVEYYHINVKIVTKDGKEYSHTIENSTSTYVDTEESPIVIAILNPYILCLSKDIKQLITRLKDGFIYDNENGHKYYNYKKSERYFDDNHDFIKKISKIDSIESIKSIEISGSNPYDKNFGDIIHKFDMEDLTYQVTDTSNHELIVETSCDVIKFNPSYISEYAKYLSFYNESYNGNPHGGSDNKIYNIEDKCIICPTCYTNIDKDSCLVSRKHQRIFCDEHCIPRSKYWYVRYSFHRDKKLEFTQELVNTKESGRPAVIEQVKVGTPVTFKYDKDAQKMEVLTSLGSVGMVSLYAEGYGKISALSSLESDDKNIIYEAFVSNVVPSSQRPKKGMKPIVEITVKAEILIN